MDNILLPENRAHLSLEVQLKELLEKLDLVSTMRSSGARTRRVRLLRREINTLRHKLAQQQPNKMVPNGELPPGPREEVDVVEKALHGEEEEDGEKGERCAQAGPSVVASGRESPDSSLFPSWWVDACEPTVRVSFLCLETLTPVELPGPLVEYYLKLLLIVTLVCIKDLRTDSDVEVRGL